MTNVMAYNLHITLQPNQEDSKMTLSKLIKTLRKWEEHYGDRPVYISYYLEQEGYKMKKNNIIFKAVDGKWSLCFYMDILDEEAEV